jgi:phosphonate transport system substrate-binding protein
MGRNKMNIIKKIGVLVSICLIGTGAYAEQCRNPEQLRFSIIPTEESSFELDLYKPILVKLKQNTGKKIEFYMPTSYASVAEALMGGFVDIAVLGPYGYITVKEKEPSITVFATYAKKKGYMQNEGPGYQSVLITKKGSKFTTEKSLKGTTVGHADPGSTSGDLIPRIVWAEQHMKTDADNFWKRIVYTGGHDLTTLAVFNGKVDAGFVATHRFDNVVSKGQVKLEDFNILWRSPSVPQDPFVFSGKLCKDIQQNITKTFLELGNDPGAAKFLANLKSSKFVAMTDKDYDVIRTLAVAKAEFKKKKEAAAKK